MPRQLRPILMQILVCLTVLGCLLQTGCVRRRLMVRSNPSGAMAYVDNQPIGTTPCATDFTYYGTREIRLVKAGYETLTINQPLPAPWYQIAPLDFVSENIVPAKIQDYRTASFNLSPQVIVPTEQLIANGEQLRQSMQQSAVLPANSMGAPNFVLPPGTAPSQTILGQPTLGQPTPGQPRLGPPTLAPPSGFGSPPPIKISPGRPIAPPPFGAGTLPIGGQPLETLPPPRR